MKEVIKVKLFKANKNELDTVYVIAELEEYFKEQAERFKARIISIEKGAIFESDGKKYFIGENLFCE